MSYETKTYKTNYGFDGDKALRVQYNYYDGRDHNQDFVFISVDSDKDVSFVTLNKMQVTELRDHLTLLLREDAGTVEAPKAVETSRDAEAMEELAYQLGNIDWDAVTDLTNALTNFNK